MALLAVGLSYATSTRRRRATLGVALTGYAIVALAIPFTTIRPAYAPPDLIDPLRAGDETLIVFEDGAQGSASIVGITAIRDGDWLFLQLAWRVDHAFTDNYQTFVHLRDADNQIVAQRDTHPGLGARPTTRWRAGETFGDIYPIYAGGSAAQIDTLALGLYAFHTPGQPRLAAVSEDYAVQSNAVIVPLDDLAVLARNP